MRKDYVIGYRNNPEMFDHHHLSTSNSLTVFILDPQDFLPCLSDSSMLYFCWWIHCDVVRLKFLAQDHTVNFSVGDG